MDTTETYISPIVTEDGYHLVALHFRARNQYGAMETYIARGLVDNATCEATLTAIE